jgi:hypothetical protein
MDRRYFLQRTVVGLAGLGLAAQAGCRSNQTAQVVKPGDHQYVGSNAAGQETYGPLVEGATSNLLARHAPMVQPAGAPPQAPPQRMRVCFLGVKNDSIEEMGDFKEQVYQLIDARIRQSGVYDPVSKTFVQAGLQQCRLRFEDLFIPGNMRMFTQTMEQMQQPFDYMLFATLTTGTTRSNKDYQRSYQLTLEMINVRTGQSDKEYASLEKQYNVSAWAKLKNLGPH